MEVNEQRTTTHALVMKMIDSLKSKGHHVYMDNYYSSPSLFAEMKENGIGARGTVRLNRKKMPNEGGKRRNTMKKGEVRWKKLENGILALQWKDKRVVSMISTIHNSDMTTKSRRSRNSHTGTEEILKPVMIDQYNTYMGGVDKSDQLLSYYGFNHHRSTKWYKRAIFHILDLAIVNSYILYQMSVQTRKQLTHVLV